MALDTARANYRNLLNTIGTSALNAAFPDDFEAYMIGFELVNSDGRSLEYFAFPVMPNSISITEPEITNIKKVNGGVVSLKTRSFVPKDISLSGNFGRMFKILFRTQGVDFTSFDGTQRIVQGDFQGPNIKTGFGSIKAFGRILDGSKKIDNSGRPCRLYFYNFAFSQNYVVEVVDKVFSQSREMNAIWNYSVNLKAVAPINDTVISDRSLIRVLGKNTLQRGVNQLATNITSILP